MPRGKGGARQGTPGQAYGNRTDLNMPISTVPNQEYGKATQQQAAQSAVPMASSPVATAPAPAAPAPARAQVPAPGSLPHLDPTQRPEEPVTAGIPFGPGPGPEAIVQPRNMVSNELGAMTHNSPILAELSATARLMGL